jgi:arylsulfatase A-like enzyme
MAIRQGEWKLVAYDPVVDGGRGKATPKKLYNLAADIGEQHDLAASEPDKVNELQAAWDEWNESNVPPKWGSGGSNRRGRRAASVRPN